MLPKRLAFIDVETTGGKPNRDRIIEIGVVVVENGKKVVSWETLINPLTTLPPEITQLTGIKAEDLYSAPVFGDIYRKLQELLKDSVFVAHNARFDYAFVKHEFRRLDINFSAHQLCTVRLSKKLFPSERHHNLDALIERFKIKCKARHRALGDAEATWVFVKKAVKKIDEAVFDEAIHKILQKPSLPPNIPDTMVKNLPECPGVYIFYDASGVPLYVGKSINIKERVSSHFYSDIENFRELQIKQQVTHIETKSCAGELEALLAESQLVKTLQPIYNRKLRTHSSLASLQLTQTKSGYSQIMVERNENITVKDLPQIYGIFRSKKAATNRLKKLVEEHRLCWKLSGLEKGAGACFAHHLGDCKGACVGKENHGQYNLRVLTGLTTIKLMSWPFDGLMSIAENNKATSQSVIHVFDHWCHIGSFKSVAEFWKSIGDQNIEINFDLDIYQLLKNFLRQRDNLSLVQPIVTGSKLKVETTF